MRLAHLVLFSLVWVWVGCSSDEDSCQKYALGCPSNAKVSDARFLDARLFDRSGFEQGGQRTESGSPPRDSLVNVPHEDVTVDVVHQWLNDAKVVSVIDVRELSEYQTGHLAGAQNLPWGSGVLNTSLSPLPTDRPLVVYCQSGSRSNAAATFLAGKGFKPVFDMQGGINAWKAAGYPTVQ